MSDAARDNRVSVVRVDEDEPLAVLLTFGVEMRNAVRIELQRVIAVWLPVRGNAIEIADPEFWLRLAAPDQSLPVVGVWQGLFSHWVAKRRRRAESVASAVMEREATRVTTDHQRRTEREASDLHEWLSRRADDICGAFTPRTGDLFGAIPDGPRWQLLSVPLDRLAAFVADGDNGAARGIWPSQRFSAQMALVRSRAVASMRC